MKRRIVCFTPGMVARAIINASTANYEITTPTSNITIHGMPNYRHDKISQLKRSEVAMLARMIERDEALARCIKPYIKTK